MSDVVAAARAARESLSRLCEEMDALSGVVTTTSPTGQVMRSWSTGTPRQPGYDALAAQHDSAVRRCREAECDVVAEAHPMAGRVSIREVNAAEDAASASAGEDRVRLVEVHRLLRRTWDDQGTEFDVAGYRIDHY